MTKNLMPEDVTGRIVAITGRCCEDLGAAALTVPVINPTGKVIRLIGASAVATAGVAATTVDIQNGTGTMLTGLMTVSAAFGTAVAGTVLTTNDTVAAAGLINFIFSNAGGAMLNGQCTAYFTVQN